MSDRVELAKINGQGEKIEESRIFAEDVQDSLSRLIQLSTGSPQDRSVGRAPLVVLAGANMPSVLTEISFLSNPLDQQLLRKVEYRERLAEGLFHGVATYLQSLNSVTWMPIASCSPSIRPANRATSMVTGYMDTSLDSRSMNSSLPCCCVSLFVL